MSTFTGILLDVSGSMRSIYSDGLNKKGGSWTRSIFTVIDDFVKHDVSRDNHVFTIGFGGEGKDVFDIIGSIKSLQKKSYAVSQTHATDTTIDRIFHLLQTNGARTIRKWATTSTVSQAVSEYEALIILEKLTKDKQFREKFVSEYLPDACRDWNDDSHGGSFLSSFVKLAQDVSSTVVSRFHQATSADIQAVVKKAFSADWFLIDVSDQSVYNVHEAANVIRGHVHEQELTIERAKELLKIVEPFIYGSTPMYTALKLAADLFQTLWITYCNHHRLLFVLSDGRPSERGDINRIISQLRDVSVTVVTCYISDSSNVEPRRLHSSEEHNWDQGAKFLFHLSSKIPTDWVARAIFIKRGWKLDFNNNEARFFMHVNHPDNLKDVCDIAQKAVSSQDALSNLLASVSLDVYINQKNTSITAHEQVGGTCYANASATVLHLAMHRIIGREGGYPNFEKLRDGMISSFGEDGANTFDVLREMCPPYRLHCQMANVDEALEAVTKLRPIVARFYLTDDEWAIFKGIYRDHNNQFHILKKSDIDRSRRSPYADTKGHAVVLTSYNSECLRLMNSWGEDWADNGFFRVENAEVLGLQFIDVFWTKNDLTQREKDYYRAHGPEVADKLMRSLRSLQVAEFICPLCKRISQVTEFYGTVSQARCPMCRHEFSTADGDGNILALNLYLTSLSK